MSGLPARGGAGKDIPMYLRPARRRFSILAAFFAWVLAAASATAQDAAPDDLEAPAGTAPEIVEMPPPIYEKQLLRISEILGSLHFLRRLCGDGDEATWRAEMRALLDAEQPTPQRKARLVGRFNHGFETYNSIYRSCTPSARKAISRYLEEGAALSKDVRTRYSQ
jgi:uncharacterized protein (TIGR02301 family)